MEKKEQEIQEQNDALNDRLTAMYKTGTAGFVDVILNSEDIEDLLTNVGMVHKILESDQELLKKLQKDYEILQELKQELEYQEASLEEQQISLEAKEVETEELKKKYQKEADEMHALQKQKEAEAAEMAAQALHKQLEAERMIVESGGKIDMAPGQYAWPTASNWQLSDKYGWRICPFHGNEFHNGLDIVLTSGTNGAPVYAIADGYVTSASWYGGYGNCIQYAIGNGYSVLYGHLSGYNCKAGQYVTKGSVLGYIGSTGASTGPHLHFTVFQNGQHINPLSLY
jgi:murein DD-endopeptidase MepM/ murein hydrolase activator NlpD